MQSRPENASATDLKTPTASARCLRWRGRKDLNSFQPGATTSLRHKAIDAGGDSGIDGQYRYLRPQLIRLLAGINDRQLFELRIRERNTHRGCERRRIHPLDLYAETAAALEQQQIEFGAQLEGLRAQYWLVRAIHGGNEFRPCLGTELAVSRDCPVGNRDQSTRKRPS